MTFTPLPHVTPHLPHFGEANPPFTPLPHMAIYRMASRGGVRGKEYVTVTCRVAKLQAIHIRVEWMPDDAQAIDFKPITKRNLLPGRSKALRGLPRSLPR
jgi:hypothetical protein